MKKRSSTLWTAISAAVRVIRRSSSLSSPPQLLCASPGDGPSIPAGGNAIEASFYDLKRLFSFRATLEKLDPESSPRALFVHPPASSDFQRIGILSGSFNPPTLAHQEVARQAQKVFRLDSISFTLSRRTIDKERVEGLMLEDRLLLLSLMAQELRQPAVAAVNRGLYFEQAKALRSLMGNKVKLYFIVGMDKVLQIFDPRYYEDRERALGILFTESQLIAAGRGGLGEKDLEELLERAENEPYRDRIYFMPLAEEITTLSSSAIRNGVKQKDQLQGLVPELVETFLRDTAAYQPDYELRRALVDRLFQVRDWAEKAVDFRRLLELATEKTQTGEKLRKVLSSPATSSSGLKSLIQSSHQPRAKSKE